MSAYWRNSRQFIILLVFSTPQGHSRGPPLHFAYETKAALSILLATGEKALADGRILENLESFSLLFYFQDRESARGRFAKAATSLHLRDGERRGQLISWRTAGASGCPHMQDRESTLILFKLISFLGEIVVIVSLAELQMLIPHTFRSSEATATVSIRLDALSRRRVTQVVAWRTLHSLGRACTTDSTAPIPPCTSPSRTKSATEISQCHTPSHRIQERRIVPRFDENSVGKAVGTSRLVCV